MFINSFSLVFLLFNLNMKFSDGLLKYRTSKEHFLVDERFSKKDILYLFVFPRTSNITYFGAMSLYVESVLTWKQIPFYRISNQFFLGSKTDGTIPFAIYNGKYLDGSEKIIEEIRKKGNKKLGDENDDIRKFAIKTLLKILIADRTFRHKKEEELSQIKIPKNNPKLSSPSSSSSPKNIKHFGPINIKLPNKNNNKIISKSEDSQSPNNKNSKLKVHHLKTNNNFPKGPGGLDWMLKDEGIKEQIMQSIPEAFFDPEILIELPNNKDDSFSDEYFNDSPIIKKGKEEEEDNSSNEENNNNKKLKYQLNLNSQFWKEYFNILNKIKLNEEENVGEIKLNFLKENINYNCIIDDWEYINNILKNIINNILKKLLIDGQELPFCWEKRLREVIGGKNVNEIELFNKFQNEIKSLGLIKKLINAEKNNEFLNGSNPSLADFALFAFLNQFFESPLNIPEFKKIFNSEKFNENEKEGKLQIEKNNNIDKNLFLNYINKIKKKLGKFGDDEIWTIMRQRPWPLNFELLGNESNEEINNIGDKFEGPFNIEVNELTNIDKLFDENNIQPLEILIKDESFQLKKELIKLNLLWTNDKYLNQNNIIQKNNNNEAGPSEQKEENIKKENNNLNKLKIILNNNKENLLQKKDFLINSPKEKNNFENEIILYIIEIILEKIINKFKNEIKLQKIFAKLMILEMAAFICNLGKNKTEKEAIDCKEKHKEISKNYLNIKYLNKEINEESFFNYEKETKKLVYKSIIKYIEDKIASKVRIAISNVAALINIDPKNTQEIRDEN